jgi:uncharacterized protein with HEPN domain
MIKDDLIYIEHMLLYADRIAQRMQNKARDDFECDPDLKDLVVYRLQVIGEAARHISDEFQKRHPQIDWSDIIGMRHRLVHGYLDIDYDVVWNTVTIDLPRLIAELDGIVTRKKG